MMTAINGVMLAAGSSLAALIVVKVTIVAALGLAAAGLARRSRAAVRHALLAVTFGATLVLPIASVVAPPVQVTMPVVEVSRAAWPLVVNTTAPIPPVTTAADGARVAPSAPQQSSTFSLSVLLLAGWIVGTSVFLVPVMTGLWQIRSLRRSGLPWLDGQSIAKTLALDAGIHRRVEVLLHEALPGPITCGVLDPAIVLPREAESWAREDLSRAIVHELEHVRRGDSATRCLARAACALYWFHPLAWIAWRKLVLEAERSCDDAVLRRSEATAYADQLVGLAKRLPTAQRSPLLAMASRSDLSARVGAVLDSRQSRGRAGTCPVALACAAAVVLVIAMSPLMLVAAPQAAVLAQTATSQSVTPPQFGAVSVKPVDPKVQGEQPHEKPDPLRLVAQAQSATVDRTVSAAPARPAFEVAAIKPNPLPGGRFIVSTNAPPFRISGTNVTMQFRTVSALVQAAYNVKDYQVTGAPAWAGDRGDYYDIEAKAPGDTAPSTDQVRLMLQSLLADRFQLTLHRDSKEMAVYHLVIGKNGPKLKPIAVDAPLPQLPQNTWRTSIEQLTGTLSRQLDRPMIDQTGLTGAFEYTMNWGQMDIARRDNPDGFAAADLSTAIQEQLGLKLESAKEQFPILIIDRVEKPTAN